MICAEIGSESFVILEKRRPLTCRAKPMPCQRFCRVRHNGLPDAFTRHVFPKLDIPVLANPKHSTYLGQPDGNLCKSARLGIQKPSVHQDSSF